MTVVENGLYWWGGQIFLQIIRVNSRNMGTCRIVLYISVTMQLIFKWFQYYIATIFSVCFLKKLVLLFFFGSLLTTLPSWDELLLLWSNADFCSPHSYVLCIHVIIQVEPSFIGGHSSRTSLLVMDNIVIVHRSLEVVVLVAYFFAYRLTSNIAPHNRLFRR